jgi:hypothetical protein
MITKELVDFIQKSRLFGRTDEEIKAMLLNQGWKPEDIELGFKSAEFNPAPPEEPTKPEKSKSKAWIIVPLIIILLIGLGGAGFIAYQKYVKLDDSPANEEEVAEGDDQNQEITFADNLRDCNAYKMTFKHLLTGEDMEKEIIGIVDGKCLYVEQMPNNGKMECKYTEEERVVAAQYYKDMALAESGEFEVSIDAGSGEQNTTYKINDKEVENPLQEFMNTGVCDITGY